MMPFTVSASAVATFSSYSLSVPLPACAAFGSVGACCAPWIGHEPRRSPASARTPLLSTPLRTSCLEEPRLSARSSSKWPSRVDGLWEEPSSGYGSADDDEDEDEEEEEGGGEAGGGRGAADSDGERGSLVVSTRSQGIPQEIELLLTAEEKVILQQHDAADLSKISTKKWNPFHTCALSGQIRIMDRLLEYGVHIDAVDKDGFTALHKAVIGKKEAVISHLLRKGANPCVKDRDGGTPLHYAVQVGAIQTVKLLIKYNVDVNVADNDGWTPLHIAIQSRSRDIAKVLLVNGADKTRRNKDGKSPLDISLCFGKDFKSYELAKLLKLVPANRGS